MGHIQATGFYMIREASTSIKYGLLYNWYAATDPRNIASDGWHVPTRADADALEVSIGGSTGGGKLKEAGLAYWNSPNTEATNEVKFNARGASTRDYFAGTFSDIKTLTWILTSQKIGSNNIIFFRVEYDSGLYSLRSAQKNTGYSIRLVKDSTTLSHGQTGTYTGNDGKIYRSICIGTQEWLADNLAETKFRTGETIPEVTDNAAWAALETAGMCAYDNDWSNV